ncbi:preprotein translocase subunit SecG [SAR202 cluster bacterium AC-409-J13_OGT_754m]|nr:preprotein translocase subunit SecG [SAR202 cluster bacterium AC-409-J13_OGT_754m]
MSTILNLIQLSVSITLILVILFQVREQGSGLFGSATTTFRVRRGLEKILFQATIVLVVIFVVVSILSVRLS